MYLRSKPRPLCGFQAIAPSGFIFTGWQDEYSFLSRLQSLPIQKPGHSSTLIPYREQVPPLPGQGSSKGTCCLLSFSSAAAGAPVKPCLKGKKKKKTRKQYIRHLVYSCQGFLKKKTKNLKSSISISAWTHSFQAENYQLLKTKIQPSKSEDLIVFTDDSWNRKPSVWPLEGCSRGCVNGRSL